MNSMIKSEIDTEEHNGTPLTKYLSDCENGEELTVISVNTGSRAKQRLANLGLIPGTKIVKKKSNVSEMKYEGMIISIMSSISRRLPTVSMISFSHG